MNQAWVERKLMYGSGVAWWKCDEASGNLIDSKDNYTGTSYSLTYGLSEGIGFNGTNSYVQFSSPVIQSGKKSIYFEIKTTKVGQVIMSQLTYPFSNENGIHMTIDSRSTFTITERKNGIDCMQINIPATIKKINDGVWHRFLLVWDGTTDSNAIKIYIDNMATPLATTTALHENKTTPTNSLRLGRGLGTLTAYFLGNIRNIQIYNEVVDPVAKFKFLKSNNKVYTLNEITNTIEDITSSIIDVNNITKLEYETHGFDDLTKLTSSQMEGLVKPVNLLYYRDNVDNTTSIPRLRQEYNLNVGVRQMIKKPVV